MALAEAMRCQGRGRQAAPSQTPKSNSNVPSSILEMPMGCGLRGLCRWARTICSGMVMGAVGPGMRGVWRERGLAALWSMQRARGGENTVGKGVQDAKEGKSGQEDAERRAVVLRWRAGRERRRGCRQTRRGEERTLPNRMRWLLMI